MAAALLAYLQLFGPLPAPDQTLIAGAWTPRSLAEGETLFAAGAVCRELFFIDQGVLRIVVTQETGKEVTHFFLAENRFCTILRSFTHEVPAAESILAACPARVLVIGKPRLEALYQQLPYLRPRIDQIIQQGLLDKIQTRNAYLGQDSATRYQRFLQGQPDIARRVSLTDVASYLGITPQSLSRIRRGSR
ncbi:Crp/Fnr family transcriptional regulator [Hymenobacter chitinivorans]|uniref:CRP-like cAMP-binding protein n=1 Tax=Hymenobacter chitinivorans DSM 11115 TaxID=1121954 RepID=A0A2M9BPQ0_9BACT|nr:Crp/Fnr family transcriptional regulator [Hymenobacter chitinivorans]PJJ59925.1 CRP-like cAMP-binding protein [Hymenobacter chitinivorans DSM 11115]